MLKIVPTTETGINELAVWLLYGDNLGELVHVLSKESIICCHYQSDHHLLIFHLLLPANTLHEQNYV